jgi:hypothetical protein
MHDMHILCLLGALCLQGVCLHGRYAPCKLCRAFVGCWLGYILYSCLLCPCLAVFASWLAAATRVDSKATGGAAGSQQPSRKSHHRRTGFSTYLLSPRAAVTNVFPGTVQLGMRFWPNQPRFASLDFPDGESLSGVPRILLVCSSAQTLCFVQVSTY